MMADPTYMIIQLAAKTHRVMSVKTGFIKHDGIEFISVHVDKVTRRWCYVALHPSQQQLL